MENIYMIRYHNTLYATPIPHETYRTCLVACKKKKVAKSLARHISLTKSKEIYKKVFLRDSQTLGYLNIDIHKVNCFDQNFYKHLLMNNLALILLDDYSVDVYDDNNIILHGDLIQDEYEISEANRMYLDELFTKDVFETGLSF